MPTYNTGAKTATSDGSFADTLEAVQHIRDLDQHDWALTVGSAGGNYTWAGQMVVDVQKRFTFQSADLNSGTTINSTWAGDGISWVIAPGANNVIQIKGFRIGTRASQTFIVVYGNGFNFRFTKMYVPNRGSWLEISSPSSSGGEGPFGLIDNSTLTGYSGVFVRQNRGGPDSEYPNTHPIVLSDHRAVFFEDITYDGPSDGAPAFMTDGNQAGKIVVRHCQLTNASIGNHGRDSGGTEFSDWKHGILQTDAYLNNFIVSRAMPVGLVQLRGGTGVVWGNSLALLSGGSMGSSGVSMICEGDSSAPLAWVNCLRKEDGGSLNRNGCDGTSNPACTLTTRPAGPLDPVTEYPDLQQVGLGGNAKVRIWSNSGSITPYGWAGGGLLIQQDRDYVFSTDETAKPSGYDGVDADNGYRHPLNPGPQPYIPVNNAVPIVSGVAAAGQILTGTTGNWSGYPEPSYRRKWQRKSVSDTITDISGQTGATYSVVTGDVTYRIRAGVQAYNSEGDSAWQYSLWTDEIAAPGALNRLTNGGFELHTGAIDGNNGTDAAWSGWTKTEVSSYIETTTSHVKGGSAAFAVRNLQNNNAANKLEQTFVPAEPGETMSWSVWHENAGSGNGATMTIRDMTNGAHVVSPTVFNNKTSAYVKENGTFVVPSTPIPCVSMRITFDTTAMNAGDNMWLDDVVIAPPPSEEPGPAAARIILR